MPIAPDATNETILLIYVDVVRRRRCLNAIDPLPIRAADIAALAPVLDLADDDLREQLTRVIGLSRMAAGRVHNALVRRRVLLSAAFGAAGVAALAGFGISRGGRGSSPSSSTVSAVTPSIGDAVVITPPPTAP